VRWYYLSNSINGNTILNCKVRLGHVVSQWSVTTTVAGGQARVGVGVGVGVEWELAGIRGDGSGVGRGAWVSEWVGGWVGGKVESWRACPLLHCPSLTLTLTHSLDLFLLPSCCLGRSCLRWFVGAHLLSLPRPLPHSHTTLPQATRTRTHTYMHDAHTRALHTPTPTHTRERILCCLRPSAKRDGATALPHASMPPPVTLSTQLTFCVAVSDAVKAAPWN